MTRRTLTGYWRMPEPADVRGGQHVGTARGVLVFDDALQLGVFMLNERSQFKAIGEANALLDLAAETTSSLREAIAQRLLSGELANACGVDLTDPKCPIGVALTIAAADVRAGNEAK